MKGNKAMKTLQATTIYNSPEHVFEAFSDIQEALHNKIFENIVFNADEGVLEYDSTLTGEHLRVVFDYTQATPEITADVLQWMFSMLDTIVNF